ncbi:MAG TPA: tetraacyldisaccharide 4'-kinase, partial [Terriglobia bacterium]|nr:tetraacyldisaccharide 4'-kinase [Terriglobia bacterium]
MPLSAVYRLAAGLRSSAYRHGLFKSRKLLRPVISIGNLTVGGTGKTPLVEYVASLPAKHGWKAAILTRGYRRSNRTAMITIDPEANRRIDPRKIGDEPALLASKLPQIPIVVGANRYRGGRFAEEHYGVDIHILDDGFQHFALKREVDVVVLDATRKLEKEKLLPAGRLREPVAALQRAQIIVLTRVELADPGPVEEFARRINPQARIFRARTKLCELVNVFTGRRHPPGDFHEEPAYAFCGVGNPGAFFADLSQWGFKLAGTASFADHHVYSKREFAMMMLSLKRPEGSTGVKVILTTEKDAQNL